MYAHDIVRIDAEPYGAAATGLIACSPPVLTIGCPGRNGFKCSATPIGLADSRQLGLALYSRSQLTQLLVLLLRAG